MDHLETGGRQPISVSVCPQTEPQAFSIQPNANTQSHVEKESSSYNLGRPCTNTSSWIKP
ncbi:hypothetical protein EYF80_066505 [Liparis tanakae]|uniref:Uncharacterized protein n=1 Tax=Liparis tanakae TaxID=230148 RepID=A0A4Z2E385_9TELE|nr:hypothetical protein EYF80_066505 [Liparis tanakae]